jgi:hypothetical protein
MVDGCHDLKEGWMVALAGTGMQEGEEVNGHRSFVTTRMRGKPHPLLNNS